jgi:curved DNA-binding protein CbpA
VAPPSVSKVASLPPGTASDDDFERDLRERLAHYEGSDHFERLNLPRTATTEQVRSRFIDLVMRYHPDRASGHRQGQLVPLARDLFVRLKDSYDVLIDPGQRARYVATLSARAEGKLLPNEARAALHRGRFLLHRKDYAQAEIELRAAAVSDPQAEYLAELAWALLANPARREEAREEIRSLIGRALKNPDRNDRVLTVAAHVERWQKNPERAENLFRRALQMNPGNREAAENVHLFELRRSAPPSGWRSLLTWRRSSPPRRRTTEDDPDAPWSAL